MHRFHPVFPFDLRTPLLVGAALLILGGCEETKRLGSHMDAGMLPAADGGDPTAIDADTVIAADGGPTITADAATLPDGGTDPVTDGDVPIDRTGRAHSAYIRAASLHYGGRTVLTVSASLYEVDSLGFVRPDYPVVDTAGNCEVRELDGSTSDPDPDPLDVGAVAFVRIGSGAFEPMDFELGSGYRAEVSPAPAAGTHFTVELRLGGRGTVTASSTVQAIDIVSPTLLEEPTLHTHQLVHPTGEDLVIGWTPAARGQVLFHNVRWNASTGAGHHVICESPDSAASQTVPWRIVNRYMTVDGAGGELQFLQLSTPVADRTFREAGLEIRFVSEAMSRDAGLIIR